MARDSITHLWGSKAPEFPARFLRIGLAIIVAMPLAFVSMGITDNKGVPEALRIIISPGWVVALHTRSFSEAIAMAFMTNVAYYASLVFLITLFFWRAGTQPHR